MRLTPNPKTILIIDDSVDNQILLQTLLGSKGNRILCALDGQAALDLLRELPSVPDLILLDAQMPGMDGYQFRAEQQKTPRLRDIPVVVMTASDAASLNRRMIQPQGILIKPLRIEALLESISRYML